MFDFDKYLRTRTTGLNTKAKEDIKTVFNEVSHALDNGKVDRVKLLFLDLLILEKQRDQMRSQIKKLTSN